ncbi:MAG: hypothetical protein WDA08_01855 [Weeksellaceae bacterium]
MKKFILSTAIAVMGLVGLNAQSTGFEAGAFVGFPMGDAGDLYSFNFGITAGYYWNVGEGFQAGVVTGYDNFSGKTVMGYKVPAFGAIPIAASAKYYFDQFFVGADLGLGIGTSTGAGSAFYYRPRVGYGMTSLDIYAFYKGYSNNGSVSSIGVGAAYKF